MGRLIRFIPLGTLVCVLLALHGHAPALKVVVHAQDTEHKLWGVDWNVHPGYSSPLEMKNNRIDRNITAYASLYFRNGEEHTLDPLTLSPRQTVQPSLNEIIESLPASLSSRASREGTIEVEFEAPAAASVMGSVTVTNPAMKTAWNFFLDPERPGLGPAPVRGVFRLPNSQADGFVALQNISSQPLLVKPIL